MINVILNNSPWTQMKNKMTVHMGIVIRLSLSSVESL